MKYTAAFGDGQPFERQPLTLTARRRCRERNPTKRASDKDRMSGALARRRALRRNTSDAEAVLWTHLRGRRLAGFKFRRQHPCGLFILDFFCPARRLAIELDGGQHFEPRAERYEAWRTEFIAARGIEMLRFSNDQVLREREAVLLAIVFALDGHFPGR